GDLEPCGHPFRRTRCSAGCRAARRRLGGRVADAPYFEALFRTEFPRTGTKLRRAAQPCGRTLRTHRPLRRLARRTDARSAQEAASGTYAAERRAPADRRSFRDSNLGAVQCG